jgi:hypothetical protein
MMQPSIYSVEKLAEFHQLEIEKDARDLWKWRCRERSKKLLYAILISLFV